jgi:hypothetical protein
MRDILTRPQLFAFFRADVHAAIRTALDRATVRGLAVFEGEDGKPRAISLTSPLEVPTDPKGGTLKGVYIKPGQRMRDAIDYLSEHPGTNPNAAAKLFGVSSQAVYKAIKRQLKQAQKSHAPVCPCCGQRLPEKTP